MRRRFLFSGSTSGNAIDAKVNPRKIASFRDMLIWCIAVYGAKVPIADTYASVDVINGQQITSLRKASSWVWQHKRYRWNWRTMPGVKWRISWICNCRPSVWPRWMRLPRNPDRQLSISDVGQARLCNSSQAGSGRPAALLV
jgi:hypothetical protein